MSDISSQDALGLALKLAQVMSKSGSSAKRNRDTVQCFVGKLGFKDVSVVINLTSVSVSIHAGNGDWLTRTASMEHGVHFESLVRVTELVRHLKANLAQERLSGEDLSCKLDEYLGLPRYGVLVTSFQIGVSCACICMLIGGDLPTIPVVFLAAFIGMIIRLTLASFKVNVYLNWFFTAYVATTVSLLLSTFCLHTETPKLALIAPTLMLIPGVPIVNSVLDLVRKYSETGIALSAFWVLLVLVQGEGVMLAAMQFGYLVSGKPFGSLGSASTSIVHWPVWSHTLAEAALSSLTALGFAVLFQVPVRLLPLVCMVGWIGHTVKTFLMCFVSILTGVCDFTGTVCMVLMALVVERRTGVPAVVFYIPGLVMMMPGAFFMDAILNWMWIVQQHNPQYSSDPSLFAEAFFDGFVPLMRTFLIIGGLSFGVAVPTLIFRMNTSILSTLDERDEDSPQWTMSIQGVTPILRGPARVSP